MSLTTGTNPGINGCITCALFSLCQTGNENTHLAAQQGVRKNVTTKWENFEKKSKNPVRLRCGAMLINYSYSFCVSFFTCDSMIDC